LQGPLCWLSCSDNDNSTIYHSPIISSVTTGDVSATAVSAVFTGSVKDLSSQSSASYRVGVKLSTSETDVKTGTEINASPNSDGSFTVEQDGLQRNQTYYYCTFVNLQGKVSYYGDVKSFVTTDASVVTISASDIQANKATFGGATQ
jgi:phosphodiesterase/alkaline phosphatase D-like protein